MVQLTKAVDRPVRPPGPFTPGHEATGIVVVFGAGVTVYSEYVIAYTASASVKQTGAEHVDA